jgi:hypothetical protein
MDVSDHHRGGVGVGWDVDGALELEESEAGWSVEERRERVVGDAVDARGARVNWDWRHFERRLLASLLLSFLSNST